LKYIKTKTRTYHVWNSMKQRCLNPAASNYKYYGGRGITVCKRWIESFENFRGDMGEAPDGTWIDRINNDWNYHPKNCKWSSPLEQSKNKRPPAERLGRKHKRRPQNARCSIEGCERPFCAKMLCRKHYSHTKTKKYKKQAQ